MSGFVAIVVALIGAFGLIGAALAGLFVQGRGIRHKVNGVFDELVNELREEREARVALERENAVLKTRLEDTDEHRPRRQRPQA